MSSVLFSLLFLGSVVPGIVGIEAPLYLQRIANETKDYADFFVVPVTVGNPATKFNLTVSLSYFDSTVIGAGSTKARCSEPTHKGFDMSRSTTFRKTSKTPYTMSLDADMVGQQCRAVPLAKVTVGTDDFLGVKQVPFGVISHFRGGWSSGWPSDGILGLNGPDNSFAEQPATVKTIAEGDDATTVALYLSSTLVQSLSARSLQLENVKYATPYFAGQRTRGWNFYVNGAQLGDTLKNNVGGKGFLDSANSQLLEMPWNTFEALMGEIEAKKDETTGRYYVDCEDVPDFPNLTVQLDGGGYLNDLHFPPAAYVDLTAQEGRCEVLLRSDVSHSDAPAGLFWTFGNRLWEYYCVVLNYDTGYVGFSQLQH